MSLVKSVVYEAMRIEPAVPYQYAKAREDLIVKSHDASFEIKKGETIFGYQPFANKDPRVLMLRFSFQRGLLEKVRSS
jgi:hydroperoxide dehydratase